MDKQFKPQENLFTIPGTEGLVKVAISMNTEGTIILSFRFDWLGEIRSTQHIFAQHQEEVACLVGLDLSELCISTESGELVEVAPKGKVKSNESLCDWSKLDFSGFKVTDVSKLDFSGIKVTDLSKVDLSRITFTDVSTIVSDTPKGKAQGIKGQA